jgi:hypothetical protein
MMRVKEVTVKKKAKLNKIDIEIVNMSDKKVKDKFTKVIEEFNKLKNLSIDKIRELLETGILPISMLEFDFDEGDIPIEAEFEITYGDKTKETITKTFHAEIIFRVREADY